MDAGQAATSGAIVYFPDIAPLPDRDELRQLIEDSVRSAKGQAEHLAEWIELVSSDTQGKKSIAKLARWYPLQHYRRTLYDRHQTSLHRGKMKVALALAESLHITNVVVERDLRDIDGRLRAQ